MNKIRVYFDINFVKGNLKGIELFDIVMCDYPASSHERVVTDLENAVITRRLHGQSGSKYIVTGYRIENI